VSCILAILPENKNKRQGAKTATGIADDDFDKMLAEVTAADSPADAPASTARIKASSSSGGGAGASLPELQVSEKEIIGACKHGDIVQLRRWGGKGVRVKSADFIIEAIFAGVSLDILRCLVKELSADVNGARLENGGTPLYAAAQIGNLALLQCLVEELGADVNQAANEGVTPLYIAVQESRLELGADVNQAAPDGATPSFIAAQLGHLNMVRLLVKELGADINIARKNRFTPLMVAARRKHADVVTFLIKYGANVKDSTTARGTAADISKKYVSLCETGMRRRGSQKMRWLSECVLLYARMPTCPLAGTQGCVPTERIHGGHQNELRNISLCRAPEVAHLSMNDVNV
jgi:hypothetical protein